MKDLTSENMRNWFTSFIKAAPVHIQQSEFSFKYLNGTLAVQVYLGDKDISEKPIQAAFDPDPVKFNENFTSALKYHLLAEARVAESKARQFRRYINEITPEEK